MTSADDVLSSRLGVWFLDNELSTYSLVPFLFYARLVTTFSFSRVVILDYLVRACYHNVHAWNYLKMFQWFVIWCRYEDNNNRPRKGIMGQRWCTWAMRQYTSRAECGLWSWSFSQLAGWILHAVRNHVREKCMQFYW